MAIFQAGESDIQVIQEMFPNVASETIRKLLVEQKLSLNQVIDVLVGNGDTPKKPSLATLLSKHSRENIDTRNENIIRTNRSCTWNKACVFYKRAITTSPELLRAPITVEFSGEEGLDAGALLFEFYQEVIPKINDEYFEGSDERRIPKCHWGSAAQMEMAGAVIAHSILQGGPGMPCLHPAIYQSMASDELQISMSSLEVDELPTVEDIPRNASTVDLLEMIDLVS